MKDRIALYMLTSLALSGVFTLPACAIRSIPHPWGIPPSARCPQLKATDKARVPTVKVQSFRFSDKTGRNIEIGMYGSLLRFCGVSPDREGYAFAYPDPKSPGKEKVAYYSDKKLSFGLNSITFDSNVPAGAVALGQEVIITAVVTTEDGEFQSTHEFRWTAGTDDLKVTRNIKKMNSNDIGLRQFDVFLTLNANEFSGYEGTESSSPESCPAQPPDMRYPLYPLKSKSLKVLRPAQAVDKSSNSAKGLLGESSHDYFLLPKQAGKYDVVFGLKGDSHMLKDQSLTLNYIYRLVRKVSKEPVGPTG
jgi:hypothetical protein